jgi:hypothetical protein
MQVADFNLSRALEPTDIMSSLCIQNPRWLAPEVLAGEEGGLPAGEQGCVGVFVVFYLGVCVWGGGGARVEGSCVLGVAGGRCCV